jgi:hypothetical protein
MSKDLKIPNEEKLFNRLMKESIGLILFVLLTVWVINDSRVREEKYQAMVKCLQDSIYMEVKDANQKLDEIKVVVKK